ncbi:MAG: hypothetical protein K2X82_10720 [Gemmataceae bacterium]|nr:hypothetical protein [Gemmataceae bacterium]
MLPADSLRQWAFWDRPWWLRLILYASYAGVMAACLVWTVAVLAVGGFVVLVTRLLPPRWRPAWDLPPPKTPPAAPCPDCGAAVAAGPVTGDAQTGECSDCGRRFWRVYCRTTFGGFWWRWEPKDTAPPTGEL